MENNKYLFFGGSYSNLHAIQQLKTEAESLGIKPQNIFHTGDVVGYCAFPEETIDLVRDWGINVIAGNVEVQLREGEEDCGCNFEEGSRCASFSTLWYPYAQTQVSKENIEWMHSLPTHKIYQIAGKKWGVIHGGLEDISQFIFASTPWEVKQRIFVQLNVDVIVAGHCGLPFTQQHEGKTWINPGVIGMPANDGTQRVWYGIFDADTSAFQLKSIQYNAKAANIAMQQKQLPEEYAKTLVTGLWDNCEILPEVETGEQGVRIGDGEVLVVR
jgi:predicted phosphodiesterase